MAKSRDADHASPGGPNSESESVPRQRSSLWTVLVALGFAGVVGSCCLCSGALYRQRPVIRDDPEAAVDLVGRMLSIDIPDVFAPQGTIEWQVPFLVTMRGAYFSRASDRRRVGELTFLEVESRTVSQPWFRRHVVDSLHQHGAGSGFDLTVLHTETKIFEIGNSKVPFEFLTAEDR
ncbi:MAG: hypothetical protein KF861_03985, partial [Planctomycetaceae bacterium]|nr:hypothetical protein [Planctomycetaceae bacterium]